MATTERPAAAASQESPITVVGLGQCGSNVTLALSLAIDPLVIANPLLKGLATVRVEARLTDPWEAIQKVLNRKKKKQNVLPSSQHDFYIADMNLQNRAYIDELKIQAIRSTPPGQTFEQFLESVKQSHPYLNFSTNDKDLFLQATGKSQSQVKITPLVFEDPEGSAFVDGSGGLQFVSEYLASTNQSTFKGQVAARDNGTLIGIFAAGGGTGAGAILGALSSYKRANNRYTLGVSILPDRHETEAQVRAGRFLVRYLSRPIADRPDTILMFSNEGAYRALAAVDASKKLFELQLQSREVVNWYLKKFLFYYTQINQPRNEALIGKVVDPNDFRYSLAGTAFIGFASSTSNDFDPGELFAEALAPMRFSRESIAGLAVGFGLTDEKSQEVLSDLTTMMTSQEKFDECAARIRAASRFYGSLRQLCVFYFVSDKLTANKINATMPAILKCCRALTGGTPSLITATYHIEGLPDNAVMIIGKGGYLGESMRHLEAYVKNAFFHGQDKKSNDAVKAIRETIQRCNGPLDAEQVRVEKDQLVAALSAMREKGTEYLSEEVKSSLASNEKLRSIVDSSDFADGFYVHWKDVISAAVTLVDWAVVPKAEEDAVW
jgi:hypothetical protein